MGLDTGGLYEKPDVNEVLSEWASVAYQSTIKTVSALNGLNWLTSQLDWWIATNWAVGNNWFKEWI